MNVKGFVAGFVATLSLFVTVPAVAAPQAAVGTLSVSGFPTTLDYSLVSWPGNVDWTYSRDATRGNKYIQGVCYQGPKQADADIRPNYAPETVDVVASNAFYLNTGKYGTTSGRINMRLWGYRVDGYAYGMSTRWDNHPGDAWCYVEFLDWGNGSYRTYTSPTLIARSAQWFVDDPRVAA